jgi:hypothetical protein
MAVFNKNVFNPAVFFTDFVAGPLVGGGVPAAGTSFIERPVVAASANIAPPSGVGL